MRKILVSFLSILAALFLAGRLVYSSLSAQAVGSSFSSRHPQLLISEDGQKFKPQIQGFREKNLSPGFQIAQTIWLKNTGMADLEIYPVVEIKGGRGQVEKVDLANHLILQFFRGDSSVFEKSLPLSAWLKNEAGINKLTTLKSGLSEPWKVVLLLDSQAGNEVQKEKIHFDLKFVGLEKGGEKKK